MEENREADYIELNGITLVNNGTGYEFTSKEPVKLEGRTLIAGKFAMTYDKMTFEHKNPDIITIPIKPGRSIPTQKIHIIYTNKKGELRSSEDIMNTDEKFDKLATTESKYIVCDDKIILESDPNFTEYVTSNNSMSNEETMDFNEKSKKVISNNILVYNTELPAETNKKLVEAFLDTYIFQCLTPGYGIQSFVDLRLIDLVNCFKGKEQLINFVREQVERHRISDEILDRYIDNLSNKIDEAREKKGFKPSDIAEGIDPTQGEIESVEAETVERATPENEKKEKDGQTQAD